MKTLALELSSARGSIACSEKDRMLFFEEFANDRKHSGLFFENLRACLDRHGASDSIVVGLGPGSYAGTRIAIATATGLQMAHQARLVGLPSICAMDCADYCAIGDARRNSFFFARVRANELVEGPSLLSEIELRDRLDNLEKNMSIFASEKLSQFERAQVRYPSAAVLARVAQDPNRNFALPPLEPMYLREPHITTPRRGIGIFADGDPWAGGPCHNPGGIIS
jgi:tRNA threonylcarbamoyladenosine biosynthesis protein TsaB